MVYLVQISMKAVDEVKHLLQVDLRVYVDTITLAFTESVYPKIKPMFA